MRREGKCSQKGVPWEDGNVVSKSGVVLTEKTKVEIRKRDKRVCLFQEENWNELVKVWA